MKSMILLGLLVSLAVFTNAGILSGGYTGSAIAGAYSTSVISSGPTVHSAPPVATSSITQQRIVNSVPIATRIIASPGYDSASYIGRSQGDLTNIGYGSSNGGSSNSYGISNGYGGYSRNVY